MAESASVKVFARFRPYNGREKEIGLKDQRHFIKFDGTENVQLGTHSFTFDHIFGMDSQQDQLYGQSTFPMVEDVMAGYNGTLFAYGQTGAGKSFSMMGPDNWGENEAMWGMIPRATRQIFEYIAKAPMEVTFSLSVSYLEVYREVIRDLLDPSKNNLSVRESPSQGIYVDGASVAFVTSEEEVFHAIAVGDASRAVASTNMNAHSSRSHSLFILKVTQKNEVDGSVKVGTLNLVDLAGSEKISKTGASGSTLEEAKKINQSLSALANVINALADGKPHVPFRDSKLTRILQQSLGGNCKTSLIVALSPHSDNEAESLSTLRFGQRAKTIKTQVKCNEQKSAEELQILVDHLRKELATLQAYTTTLEEKLSEAGLELPTQAEVRAAAAKAAAAKGAAAASSSSSSSSAAAMAVLSAGGSGGGPALSGRDAAAFEKLRIQFSALQEEEAFLRQQSEELRADTTEAQEEAGKFEKQVADLQALREKERVLASRAVQDVKALRQEVAKKNALGMQALQEMKKLQVQKAQCEAEISSMKASGAEAGEAATTWKTKAVAAEAEKKRVEAELEEAHAWLKEMQQKVEAVLSMAQQSTEEKTTALLARQKEIEGKLEEERATVSALRKRESELVQTETAASDKLAALEARASAEAKKVAQQHADAIKGLEVDAERERADQEAVFLKQISELRQTQEELQSKLAETTKQVEDKEVALGAARKVMMSSRTTSGNHSEAWQAASDAMEAAGSPLPQRALNDSSDAWLTLKQQSLEGAKLAQQEEDDEKLAEVRAEHAQKLADVERQAEAKVMLLQEELEATKAAALSQAMQEAELKFAEEKKALEERAASAGETEEKRIADAVALANGRVEEARQQAARDLEAERAVSQQESTNAKKEIEAEREEGAARLKELEERLGAKCATIEAAAEEAREQAKADLAQAQAETDRARETSQVKVVELEARHTAKVEELEREMEARVKAAGGGGTGEAEKMVREQAKKDVELARASVAKAEESAREEIERVKASAEERVEAADKKMAESVATHESAQAQMATTIEARAKQAVDKERAETERVKQYAHARLAELEKVANEKVASSEKQAEQRVQAEQEMARQRFQQLQQQAHAQVAEMQEQTNKKIEDFRAQAQKYVTDARQQSVQQAERDLKGQYDAKLSEAQQRIHRLEQQLQSNQQQMQQLKQSRGGMMGGGGGVLRGGLQGGMQGGGMQGGGMQGGMSKFGQRPAQPSFGAISKPPASPAAAPEGVPPSSAGRQQVAGAMFRDPTRGYQPQLGMPNQHAATVVAKTGFLVKSSSGKKNEQGREIPQKHEKFQNRFFAIVDGPQPHIAWFKDQKDYRSKKAPQGTLALRQGNAMVQKGVDATLLPMTFVVSTPERNLKLKTLEGQDANDWVKLINTIADAMRKRTQSSAGS